MHPTKELLIQKNGLYCMLCCKKCKYRDLEWHHIKWKSVSRNRREPIDNSYDNGALLCINCHRYVHTLRYNSAKYKDLMWVVRSHKKP